eukprot:14205329-Ditylum_brightwellii.AAC.1
MASVKRYTSDDVYGKGKLHDIVQKRNHIMHLKGLNPSSTEDIESLQTLDFEVYFKSLKTCTDELSIKMKEMVE